MIDQKIIKIASNTKFAGLKNQYTHKSSIKIHCVVILLLWNL